MAIYFIYTSDINSAPVMEQFVAPFHKRVQNAFPKNQIVRKNNTEENNTQQNKNSVLSFSSFQRAWIQNQSLPLPVNLNAQTFQGLNSFIPYYFSFVENKTAWQWEKTQSLEALEKMYSPQNIRFSNSKNSHQTVDVNLPPSCELKINGKLFPKHTNITLPKMTHVFFIQCTQNKQAVFIWNPANTDYKSAPSTIPLKPKLWEQRPGWPSPAVWLNHGHTAQALVHIHWQRRDRHMVQRFLDPKTLEIREQKIFPLNTPREYDAVGDGLLAGIGNFSGPF